MISRAKDVASGAIFAGIGALYGTIALTSLQMGTALEMGPAYFPVILSGALVLLGIGIAARGLLRERPATPFGAVSWRAIGMISAATLVFAAFLDDLGMFPGIFLTSLIASLASTRARLLKAALASLAIAAFCTLVFSYAVRLPVPVFGPWFSWLRP